MIHVCEPVIGDEEREYVLDALIKNEISGSFGKYIDLFEKEFSQYCGTKFGITTTSGTTALHLALASMGIRKNDEVILSAFTNIATAYAAVYCGAKPVVVDSEPLTWNMDPNKIEDKITENTKVILPVHIYGHPVDMNSVLNLADKYNLRVVEDCAEAHGAEHLGRKVGGLGDIGCFSFYANKIITTGEGGMIVTNNEEFAEHAKLLRNLAFSKQRRFLHHHIGFNYRMTNIQAAIGLGQMRKIEKIIEKKREIAKLYNLLLNDVEGITLPIEMDYAKNVYWMYSILVDSRKVCVDRGTLMSELGKRGIETREFFIPMNKQPAFIKMGYFKNENCPVAEGLSEKGLYLPSSINLDEEKIEFIVSTIKNIIVDARKK